MKKSFFVLVFLFLGLVGCEASHDLRIESINFNYSELNAVLKVSNYGSPEYFDLKVKIDGKEAYSSNENSIGINESINFNISFLEDEKSILYDCMNHNITVNAITSSEIISGSSIIRLSGSEFTVEAIQKEKSLKELVSIRVSDAFGSPVSEAGVLIKLKDETVKLEKTNEKGEISFDPAPYGIGKYEIEVKKHQKISGKYYCDSKENFEVRKMLKFGEIYPENPVIGEQVMIGINSEEYGNIYLEKENKDTREKDYVLIGEGVKFFPVNFTTPGNYLLHLYKNNDFWNDTFEIFVLDTEYLKVSVKGSDGEIKSGDEIEVNVTGAKNYDGITVNLINPDGSTVTFNKNKFKYKITEPGNYELFANAQGMHSGHLSFNVLDLMALIIPENLKFNDIIILKVMGKNNKTLNANIQIDGKTLNSGSEFRIEKTNYGIIVIKEGYKTIERSITALGIIKITCPDSIEYGENEKIYVESHPKTDEVNIKIQKNDGSESIDVLGSEYEFKPSAGEYTIKAEKQQFINDTKTLIVRPAETTINSSFDYGKLIINLSSNNKPLKNAKITIKTPKGKIFNLTTDSNGTAVFNPPEDGAYLIKSEKENYLSAEKLVNFSIFPLTEIIIVLVLIAIMIIVLEIIANSRKKEKKGEYKKTEKEKQKKEKNRTETAELKEEQELQEFVSPLQK